MKNLWILLLVCAVAAAAFFLGQRTRPASPDVRPAPVAGPATPDKPTASVNAFGETLSPQPTRTFRGPDGLPMLISYEVDVVADSKDRELVKAAVLEDMKNHPRNIKRSYGLEMDEIKDIVEGRKPFPEQLLPKPPAEPPAAR
ncbi:MAG: hypothetical protein A3E01_13720 [Gammaproteobacteria bacterium RIFCSPHIGHO2_12_FULL_63_22]|nr:MAG: hypothetical protein A3E01_13720 [Gammaproteobacteria bacterium RIFCSPHIGHO2_12_FULL_63_22]